MNRISHTTGISHTTPFPNFLLDNVRPQLKGSEWNILCLIVRQTCGWSNRGGSRKESDWLTHRQIKEHTGLASASICAAIDALVKRELIVVRDSVGNVLKSAAERRRAGQLHFSLNRADSRWQTKVLTTSFQKTKTTKETRIDRDSFVDFKNENGIKPAISGSEMAVSRSQAGGMSEKDAASAYSKELRNILSYYRDRYRSHYSQQVPPIRQDDLIALQAMIEKLGVSEVQHLIDRFLVSDAYFIMRQGHSVRALTHCGNLPL